MAGQARRPLALRRLPTYSGGVVRVDTTNGLVGTELAGYLIESVIGRGGMGVVYLAEHRRLKRKVALKVLAPERAGNERFRRRFLEESRIAAGLNHPNVIPIHDADEADGVLFLAMRYVEGTDLRTLLAQEGPLEPARALRIVGQVGSALDAAHERLLVHRDVTAANVLVSADDHAYLCDFGLSKRSSSSASALSAPGEVLGTVAYIAPEQIEHGDAGPSADIYSLGCLLYQCLTGAPPFERDSDLAVLWAHMQETPPPITTAAPELPVGLDAVFARALAKDPPDRYPTCRDLVQAALASGIGPAADLPPELDTATPLVGRQAELEWLREQWYETLAGSGRMVFVSGVRGAGKTRLAAELAQEARARGAVRYASCLRQPAAARELLDDLRTAEEPTLAVVEDLDAADAGLIEELAGIQESLGAVPVLLLATYRDDATSPGLELAVSRAAGHRRLEGLDEEGVAAIAAALPRSELGRLGVNDPGGLGRDPATSPHDVARVGSRRGKPAAGGSRRLRLGRAQRPARGRGGARRPRHGYPVPRGAGTAARRCRRRPGAGRLPVQGPGLVRARGRPLLPRTRTARGRAGRAARRLVAARCRRPLRKRQVVRRTRGAAVRRGRRRAPRQPSLAARAAPPRRAPAHLAPRCRVGALPQFDPERPTAALDSLPEGDRLFLVVDQFEETFTLCQDEEERSQFIAALTSLARDARGRAVIVLAIRAAYYGRCAGYPDLAVLLGDSHVLVGPMQAEELRRAIELPAQRVGLVVEPPLVDALVARGCRRARGAAALSTTLLELWQRRDGETLRLADYTTMGGVQGAVARLAEDAYGRLTEAQQKGARGLMLRLAQEGEGGSGRSTPRPARGARRRDERGRRTRAWRCSRTAGSSPSARAPSRSPTRLSCTSGRGCARGSRRTRRATGSTST